MYSPFINHTELSAATRYKQVVYANSIFTFPARKSFIQRIWSYL